MADPNFGTRMRDLRAAQGTRPPGRKPIAEKYRPQIAQTERTFAQDMAAEADRYVAELAAKDPEQCPEHGIVLRCPAHGCRHESQRTTYDHRAAQYVFDRIMGKPSIRVEAHVAMRLVAELTDALTAVFMEINALDDADSRRTAFAARCEALSLQYTG